MKSLIHDMTLLNNTRLEINIEQKTRIIWIYHDKNYKNGTFYCIYPDNLLTLCTIRNGEYEEEIIKWKQLD